MSDTHSKIKETFFGFEPHYNLHSRSQQTDPEPVRPRIVRPVRRFEGRWCNTTKRTSGSALHSSGSADEDAQGFVDQVNRVARWEGWTADNCLLVAVTRLVGTTSQWHAQPGQNYGTWPLWSVALVTNFSHTWSFLKWSLMVEARVQKPGEYGLEYVLDKRRLCLRSPVPLPEVDIIKALLRGLANPIYIAALTAQLPVNFTDFVTRLRDLEQLGLSSVQMGVPVPPVTYTAPFTGTACPAPPVVAPPAPNFAALFQNLGDRLVN
ncbi:hypothetical protein OUZ56_023372 [Daphnia magna]|uniref:Uncharacterized protein n=1 Tax=Daphnia magna TaxID=35525 RepID=A0ABR0AZ18_9CRUS|nr:hypothetical protein OUZ56_023372 [Daphnia magna]